MCCHLQGLVKNEPIILKNFANQNFRQSITKMTQVHRSKHRKIPGSDSLCPETSLYAFEAMDLNGKKFGVIFVYKGVTTLKNNQALFYAPFREMRHVESTEPISHMGEQLGMEICWKDIDIATRVFTDEKAFLEELQLVGTACFLETSVSKVCEAKIDKENKK